jgi:aldehyde dehydrogenase (NAD+)
MSGQTPTIAEIMNTLSYGPVVDSDTTVKSWIHSHNNGILTSFIDNSYLNLKRKRNDNDATSIDTLTFKITHPVNKTEIGSILNCDTESYELAIKSSSEASIKWKSMSYTERGQIIYNIARNMQKHLSIVTMCESVNSGRNSREVKDLDVAQAIKTLYYYAGASGLDIDSKNNEAVGIVAVSPFYDSSLLSLVNKVAPALAAGNTCLIIPHKLAPLTAFMFADLCAQSNLPPGVVNLIVSNDDNIYKQVSKDPRIHCVCFDGKIVSSNDLILSQSFVTPSKRVLLSLQCKSSLVVYDSADIDSAIEAIVDGCFYSNGQHRHSLNKVLIQENIYDKVLQRLELRFAKLRCGSFNEKCNDYGSMLNSDDLADLTSNLQTQIQQYGSEVKHFNGTIQANTKDGVPPIIIKNVDLKSPLNENETSGPYVLIIPFRTVKESISILNTSKLGGAVSLHSQDVSLLLEVSYLLDAGTIWANCFPIERGVQIRKQSGNYSIHGVRSLYNFLKPTRYENKQQIGEINTDSVLQSIKSYGSSTDVNNTLPTPHTLSEVKTYKLFIGGKQARADTQASRSVYLPNKSDVYCLVADASRKDVRNAVEAAQNAQASWWKRPNHNKSQIIYYFGENLATRSADFIDKLELLTGKSRSNCEIEFKQCLDTIFYYASKCDKYTGRMNVN